MNDPRKGLVDNETGRKAIEETRARLESGAWNGKATLRATARLIQDAHIEGRIGKWRFEADEPAERGGQDQAPSPLEHFLIGAAF